MKKQRQLSQSIYLPLPHSCMHQHHSQLQTGTKFSLGNVFIHLTANLYLFSDCIKDFVYTELGSIAVLPHHHRSTVIRKRMKQQRDLEEHYCSDSWVPVSEERKRVERLNSPLEKTQLFFQWIFLAKSLCCYYNDYLAQLVRAPKKAKQCVYQAELYQASKVKCQDSDSPFSVL